MRGLDFRLRGYEPFKRLCYNPTLLGGYTKSYATLGGVCTRRTPRDKKPFGTASLTALSYELLQPPPRYEMGITTIKKNGSSISCFEAFAFILSIRVRVTKLY
ncbi:hypothetical protein EVAR_11645_1 [Eumeta japonica]|uniref:Uncharacterized protein n=1 Tax=Eumeta variegata TaxID=151549 RepID=A0A4C1WW79_EUMVA|nr:hypothetical protein EVAR_11645_1 [Eumeta japonica]